MLQVAIQNLHIIAEKKNRPVDPEKSYEKAIEGPEIEKFM